MVQGANHQRAAILRDFSLEISGKDRQHLEDVQSMLPAGTRVNITFIGNESIESRVAAAKTVKDLGFTPVPHIAARRLASRVELREFLNRLREVGATEHLFIVGGDPTTPHGPYSSAADVIATGMLSDFGAREISIAGYPDGHPDISRSVLWEELEAKSLAIEEQGMQSVLLTQFTFHIEPVIAWITAVRERGVESEIRIGTPGPAGVKRLMNFARRFGVGTNASIVKKYGFSITNLLGTAGPGRFVSDLAHLIDEHHLDAVKLHFYTFGGLQATAQWAADYLDESAA